MSISDFSNIANAPQSTDEASLAHLADLLSRAQYTNEAIAELLGESAFAALMRDQVVPARYQLEHQQANFSESENALAALTSFFLVGESHSTAEFDQALGAGSAQLFTRLGLAHLSDDAVATVRASVDLRPHSADDGVDIWVASDLPAHIVRGTLRKDHVLGIGHASRSLAQFTHRAPVERALDLGTGCGIQTFHLLAHAQHVTATDISERALAFTAFNLLLNAKALGIDPGRPHNRVELKLGSLLEPVAGEHFDLVVSNPPFVITPRQEQETADQQFTYRDGGLAGDAIVSTLVKTLPSVLNPGGTVQMLGNWEIPQINAAADNDAELENSAEPEHNAESENTENNWSERLRQWLGSDTEAWVIQREELDPAQYAETWLRDSSETANPQVFDTAYSNYLADFASRNVGSIGFGMIWIRKPHTNQQPLLQRFEEITYPLQQPIAPFFADEISFFDRLKNMSDEDLLKLHLVVASDVTEERHSAPGAEHPGVILLREGAGLRRTILESTATAGFVSACDGELNAGQIVNALEALLEWEGSDEREELIAHVRKLILQGFLRIDEEN